MFNEYIKTIRAFSILLRICSTLSILISYHTGALAQQANLDTLKSKFDKQRNTYLQEKIYAHVDQDLYLTGETLWFKLYVVDGAVHKPLEISKVAYVEILDKENHQVLQTKVGLAGGIGSGSLFLPASISSGVFTLRAYTSWMKR